MVQYIYYHKTPLGNILLAADNKGLTGLCFEGQKNFADGIDSKYEKKFTPVFEKTILWLDKYFSGEEPNFIPAINMAGTDFQIRVWKLLLEIPYGRTVTYGELARKISAKTSARAIGGAAGHNKVLIIVPCHRVIGTNGELRGYAGGIDKKARLLSLEQSKTSKPLFSFA